jgi:hypothetical protein
MIGALDALQPPELLQSLAIANKTGLLTFETSNGLIYQLALVNGKPTHARAVTVNSKGRQAITDLVTSPKQGVFVFRDGLISQPLDRATAFYTDEHCAVKEENS